MDSFLAVCMCWFEADMSLTVMCVEFIPFVSCLLLDKAFTDRFFRLNLFADMAEL